MNLVRDLKRVIFLEAFFAVKTLLRIEQELRSDL
jgi:hypothetical protein